MLWPRHFGADRNDPRYPRTALSDRGHDGTAVQPLDPPASVCWDGPRWRGFGLPLLRVGTLLRPSAVVGEDGGVTTHVLFADTTFPVASVALRSALPHATVEVIEVGDRSDERWSAEVLVPLMARVDGAAMDRIDGLRLIQQWGAGLDGVDVAAATARNIAVGNVASKTSGNADSVAEWCVMGALILSRHLGELQQAISTGAGWGAPIGQALLGRTAGIVGLGGVGQALATRLRPFGMRLIAVTRRPQLTTASEFGLEWLAGLEDIPGLLRRSDYVFLCLPLTTGTEHIIDAAALSLLQPTAYLVNAGRGGLVDDAALLAALNDGRLAGAALDVFAHEPLDPASPLLRQAHVLATPHVAGVTDISYEATARRLADVVQRLNIGQSLDHCVNWSDLSNRFYSI